jgi:hypothetical protein
MKYFNLVIFFALYGCSPHVPTVTEQNMQESISQAEVECYRSESVKEGAFTSSIAMLSKDAQLIAVLLRSQGNTIVQAIGAATGKGYNPCKTTNIFDSQVAEVEAKNKAVSNVTKSGASIIKWGIVAFGLDALVNNDSGPSSVQNYSVNGQSSLVSDSYKSGTENAMQTSFVTTQDASNAFLDKSSESSSSRTTHEY